MLLSIIQVADLIAFAAEHAVHGETVGVAVVAQQGVPPPTLRALREFGMRRLSSAKLPEVLMLVRHVTHYEDDGTNMMQYKPV